MDIFIIPSSSYDGIMIQAIDDEGNLYSYNKDISNIDDAKHIVDKFMSDGLNNDWVYSGNINYDRVTNHELF